MFDHYVRSCAHTHSIYCDGRDEPEAMVKKALELGYPTLGFSGHSFIDYGDGWTMTPENTKKYIAEIRRLKEAYRDQITIWLGTELDALSVGKVDLNDYDYFIGSVHQYVSKETGRCYGYDNKPAVTLDMLQNEFHGDVNLMAEAYYHDLAEHIRNTKAPIVGHFNLPTKFDQTLHLFNEDDPAYRRIAEECLLECAKYAACFEVNTGNMARGNASVPYPNRWMLEMLHEHHVPVMINADCHQREKLCAGYDAAEEILKDIGFKSVVILGREELLEEVPLQ